MLKRGENLLSLIEEIDNVSGITLYWDQITIKFTSIHHELKIDQIKLWNNLLKKIYGIEWSVVVHSITWDIIDLFNIILNWEVSMLSSLLIFNFYRNLKRTTNFAKIGSEIIFF